MAAGSIVSAGTAFVIDGWPAVAVAVLALATAAGVLCWVVNDTARTRHLTRIINALHGTTVRRETLPNSTDQKNLR